MPGTPSPRVDHRIAHLGLFTIIIVLSALFVSASGGSGWAADADSQSVSRVGVVQAPPFAMKNDDGNWEGIAVQLWRHVARDLGLQFEFQEMPPGDMIAAVEKGELIAVVTATATADREKVMDLSHPYYSSGLGIAVRTESSGSNWRMLLDNIFSLPLLHISGALVVLLLLAATLIWLFERGPNPGHFRAPPLQGIADGLWWAAVTLTTVGYGDKAPLTRLGRVIGVLWMFAAVILMTLFTAHVTSTLTVTSLGGRIRGPADLPHVRVGTVEGSQAREQLRAKLGVVAAGYAGFAEGLEALDRGDIDAFVAVEPVLRYEIANRFPAQLRLAGAPFLRDDYVFALPPRSALRKAINESLLSFIDSDEWQSLLRLYLGKET